MTDRFSPVHIFTASFSQMQKRAINAKYDSPDWLARSILVLMPLAALYLVSSIGAPIKSPELILAGVGILAGAFMASFGQLASWRAKLVEDGVDSSSIACRRIDEAAAHALAGTASGVVLSALLVLRAVWAPSRPDGGYTSAFPFDLGSLIENGVVGLLDRLLSGCIVAAGAYLMLLILMSVSLFWTAYADIYSISEPPKRHEIGPRAPKRGQRP